MKEKGKQSKGKNKGKSKAKKGIARMGTKWQHQAQTKRLEIETSEGNSAYYIRENDIKPTKNYYWIH